MTTLKRRDKPTVSLDSRIAAFLANSADTADSATVAALIAEAEAAIVKAKEAAEKEAERALDPLNVDAAKSRAKAENIRFECERLTRAIPLLETALHRAREREHAASWEKEYERIEATRDDLAAELSDLYPDFVARLVDLFGRIAEVDREVDRINGSAPSGERRRLRVVELKARKLDRFTGEQPPLADKLRLPDPGLTSVLAFPPEQGNPLGLLMASAAAALATKQAALHSPDWARERERQIAEEQQQADARQAEIDEQEREKKREYEKSLVENDRARRTGRRRQEA